MATPSVELVMSMKERRVPKHALSAKQCTKGTGVGGLSISFRSFCFLKVQTNVLCPGSPRIPTDEEDYDVEDLENEFRGQLKHDHHHVAVDDLESLQSGRNPQDPYYTQRGHPNVPLLADGPVLFLRITSVFSLIYVEGHH